MPRPDLIPIGDPDDPRVADYANVKDAWLRVRSGEHPTGMDGGRFMAEGVLVVEQLLRSEHAVESALVASARLPNVREVIERIDAPVYVAEPEVMNAIAGFDIHRGLMAVGVRRPPPALDEILDRAHVLLICEDMANHDNTGSLFRSCAALAGRSGAILFSPRSCDPFYRKSIRVSMGQVLHIPSATIEPWPDAFSIVRDRGFELLAMTPAEGSVEIDAIDPAGPDRRIAIMLGAEGPGLTEAAMERADRRVRIPIDPGADSLNVAVAGAIALHRLARPSESR